MPALSGLFGGESKKSGRGDLGLSDHSFQRRHQYFIRLRPTGVNEPRSPSQRRQGFHQLVSLPRRPDRVSKRNEPARRFEKLPAHGHSEGSYPDPRAAHRKSQIFRQRRAGLKRPAAAGEADHSDPRREILIIEPTSTPMKPPRAGHAIW